MRAMSLLLILAGSAAAWAAPRTGNELILFRMILRKDMEADVQAAAGSTDPAILGSLGPLETALQDLPRVHEFHAIMTNMAKDMPTRFNAARALAYFGDMRSVEFLSNLARGEYRYFCKSTDRSRAGVCLLYLGCDLPAGFLFSRLTPPLHPELDAFLDKPAQPLWSSSPYTSEQLQTAIALYLETDWPVTVRGPLSVVTAEQETLAAVLRDVAEHHVSHVVRAPFGNQVYEWEEFKDQILPDDLLYHFRFDETAWQAQEGCEGYVLVRDGWVVAAILTGGGQSRESGLLVFDDFNGGLGFGWTILNPDPSHWSLFEVPGALTITTQDGAFTGNRQDYRNIFLMDCPAAPGQDFQITTCLVSFQPISFWNQAGLLLWNSSDHYLKLDYEYGEGPLGPGVWPRRIYTAAVEIGGAASFTWYAAEQDPERVWLRIVKRGGFCELFASTDGESFSPLTALVPEYGPTDHRVYWGNTEVKYVGLFAKNGTTLGAPSVDASFDFFEVRALPPSDE